MAPARLWRWLHERTGRMRKYVKETPGSATERPRIPLQFIALLGLLCLSSYPAWALDPAKPPGQNFDLSHWKLQLPTIGGVLTGTGGSVDEVQPSALAA